LNNGFNQLSWWLAFSESFLVSFVKLCVGKGSSIHNDAMHKPISNLPRELTFLLFYLYVALFVIVCMY